MYWVTSRSCPECKGLVFCYDKKEYEALKNKILSELPGNPSNPWTESPNVHFGIGLVKIYIDKKKHKYFKYKMKCYSCDREFQQEEYEQYLSEKNKQELRRIKLKTVPGQFGLWRRGEKIVYELEKYGPVV